MHGNFAQDRTVGLTFSQRPPLPDKPLTIYSVGTGAIVENAHYPAYQKMGWRVEGLFDIDEQAAESPAKRFQYGPVFSRLQDLVSAADLKGIYDLAVPGASVLQTLEALPDDAYVLIQKPLGETLPQAVDIVSLCEKKRLHAAVNFQLRWAPYTLVLKQLIESGKLGDAHDLEVHVNAHTPWALWTFLEKAPRMEMVYHSIHYIDLIRHLFGEPNAVLARSIKDPRSPNLQSSRSNIYLDYGDWKRASIHTYHGHVAGPRHQDSYVKVEGTKGVAKFQMGLNMDYPKGRPDYFEYWLDGMDEWTAVPLEGSWFPDAFCGPMAAMMIWAGGGEPPSTEVHDALKTMQVVDTAYRCSDAVAEGRQLS